MNPQIIIAIHNVNYITLAAPAQVCPALILKFIIINQIPHLPVMSETRFDAANDLYVGFILLLSACNLHIFTLAIGHIVVLLCRRIFFFTDRFYAEHKVNHVAYPYDGKYDARHPDVFSSHYEKTYAHQQCNRRKDRRLSPQCHAFFLDERIQMLLIHVCAYKPIVQLLR